MSEPIHTPTGHVARSEADLEYVTTLAGDLLCRIWQHNPDIAFDAFGEFVLGETEEGQLGVWRGQPDEFTRALETFGGSDDAENFGDAIAWMAANRTASAQLHRSL